jgi:plasmid stabilization system protein ParE
MPKKFNIVWDDFAKNDLKNIYRFNKKHFSTEFAIKVRTEIYTAVGNIVFLEQWQKDEILNNSARRIIVRDYKIVYLINNKNQINILMIFDTRQNPSKFKLEK